MNVQPPEFKPVVAADENQSIAEAQDTRQCPKIYGLNAVTHCVPHAQLWFVFRPTHPQLVVAVVVVIIGVGSELLESEDPLTPMR